MKQLNLLKAILPGLLPLIIFIVADEIWGHIIGLYIAVATGIIQMLFILIKYKKLDKFVLIDTLMIVFLGVISIVLDNEIFFKLKPAVIGVILCMILAFSAFSKKNIMLLMSQHYFKNIQINPEQEKIMKKNTRVMFWLFSAHTILVIYSAFFMSDAAWGFISGGLFYIIFGVYFLIELVKKKIKN